MSHALQVRFVRLDPNEDLIALAAAHYKHMRCTLEAPGECTVYLERDVDAAVQRVDAVVKLSDQGRTRAEARASHSQPEVALRIALTRVREKLAEPGAYVPPAWRETAELA
jgi:hypothetical protein